MPAQCSVKYCGNKKKLFSFPGLRDQRGRDIPENVGRRQRWVEALNKPNFKITTNSRVCTRHFQTGHPNFCNDHPDYVPNLLLGLNTNYSDSAFVKVNDEVINNANPKMPKSAAERARAFAQRQRTLKEELKRGAVLSRSFPEEFVNNCSSDTSRTMTRTPRNNRPCFICGNKDSELFEFPHNIATKKKWFIVLEKRYKLEKLRERDGICVKHFLSSCLNYGKDGITLKKGAVPKVFGSEVTRNSRIPVIEEVKEAKEKSEEDNTENNESTDTAPDVHNEATSDVKEEMHADEENNTTIDITKDAILDADTDITKKEENDKEVEYASESEDSDNDKITLILENRYTLSKSQIPLKISAEEKQESREIIHTEVAFAKATKRTKLHCTVCDKHLGTSPLGQFDRYIHPVLNTLLCEQCYHFFNTGEFTKDEDGSEIYCKWCAQGGTVMCCSRCPLVFCKDCVLRNLGDTVLDEIANADTWDCFRCNPKQLSKLHSMATAVHDYTLKQITYAIATENEDILKRDISLCCKPDGTPNLKRKELDDDEEEEEFIPASKRRSRLSRISPMSPDLKKPNFMQPGIALVNKAINNLPIPPTDTPEPATPPVMMKIRAIPTALLKDPKPSPEMIAKRESSPVKSPTIPHLRKILPAPSTSLNPNPHQIELMPSLKQQLSVKMRTNINTSETPPPLVASSPPPLAPRTPGGVAGIRIQMPSLNPPPLRSTFLNQPKVVRIDQKARTSWLKRAIETSSEGVNTLLEKYANMDKEAELPKNPSELAEMHNKMQHIMSHCTNLLIETRKRMHREFLDYLAKSNVSHSSIGRNGSIGTTTASTSKPPVITSASGVTVPVIAANRNQIVLKSNSATPSPNELKLLKPMLMKQAVNQHPVILRPGNTPLTVRPTMNLLNNALQGLKPVILSPLQAGVRLPKGAVMIPSILAKPPNKMVAKVMTKSVTPKAYPAATAAGTIGKIKIAKNLKKNVFISSPPTTEKDPLAMSDDEGENGMLSMLQPEVILQQNVSTAAVDELQLPIDDLEIRIKVENDDT